MALSSLTASMSTNMKWTAQNDLTGSVYNPVQNTGNINKSYSLSTSNTNAQSGGADELFSYQIGITAGSSTTVSLIAMTNIMQQATAAIVAIKGYQTRLLSAADDPTITPAPNASSTVTVTNNVTVPAQLDFGTGGSGLTIDVTDTAGVISGVVIGAAGTLYPKSSVIIVTVNQASGAGALIAVTVNGSGVPTAVAIVEGGTGYTTATGVATTVIGQYTLGAGSAHMYFDVRAAGFCPLSATKKNIKFMNNDPSNAVTVELDVIGCTS